MKLFVIVFILHFVGDVYSQGQSEADKKKMMACIEKSRYFPKTSQELKSDQITEPKACFFQCVLAGAMTETVEDIMSSKLPPGLNCNKPTPDMLDICEFKQVQDCMNRKEAVNSRCIIGARIVCIVGAQNRVREEDIDTFST